VTAPELTARKQDISAEFNGIARRYDWLGTYDFTFVRNIRKTAERMELGTAPRVLDVCCGTGQSMTATLQAYPDADITGIDRSPGMLAIARSKPIAQKVRIVEGNATDPRGAGIEGDFDAVLSSWGIRNIPDTDLALQTVFDVLKPGGRFGMHEFVLANRKDKKIQWDVLSWGFIVPFGKLTSPRSSMYSYLWKSVVDWDTVDELCDRMRAVGFTDVKVEGFGLWWSGILHSIVATKPA